HGLLVYRVQADIMATRRALNLVNAGVTPGIRLEEADGRYDLMSRVNRGDARDPFPGTGGASRFADDTSPSTVTYDGRPLNTSLQAVREVGTDALAYVQLSPTGWGTPKTLGPLGDTGALVPNASSALAADPNGDLWLAYQDNAPTGTEIFLRRKRFGLDW